MFITIYNWFIIIDNLWWDDIYLNSDQEISSLEEWIKRVKVSSF